MTIEEIRELIQTVVATGVAELEVQRGENRVWIKRAAATQTTQEIHVAAPAPAASTVPVVSVTSVTSLALLCVRFWFKS